ncbi:Ig-like domain-containing protein [Kaarinaea lacus]
MNQKTARVKRTFLKLIYISLITVIFVVISGCSSGGGSGGGGNNSVVDTGGTDTSGGGTDVGGADTGGTNTGGGGGDISPPLGVISVDPANGDTSIERNAMVTATFSDGMDEATINDSSFTLGDSNGNTLSGNVSFDPVNNVATFTPSSDLGVFRTYTATLTADITHSGGTPITEMNWSFITRDGVWSPAEQIESDIAVGTDPQVAFDPDGNAIAVWINDGSEIYANKFTASSNMWGTAVRIDSLPSAVADLQLAMGNDGTAIAVWTKAQGQARNIRAARYNGTSWEAHVGIESNGGIAQSPQVAVDSSGNAFVVWLQPDNSVNSIWYNHYDASGAGWGSEDLLELTDFVAYAPHVAIDDSGNAIAVWAQDNGSGISTIYAAKYTTGASWGTAEPVGASSSDGYTAQVAMDGDGDAIVIWYELTATSPYYVYSLYANLYSGSAWGTPIEIENGVNIAATPQIAFDAQGNAMSVWKNSSGRLRYNTCTFNTGWGTAANVESGTDATFVPQLAVDTEGNAIVVWRQYSSGTYVYSMWASRYQLGNGWGMPELLELDDTNAASFPSVAVDRSGNAFAIWIQNDGISDSTWISRFQ